MQLLWSQGDSLHLTCDFCVPRAPHNCGAIAGSSARSEDELPWLFVFGQWIFGFLWSPSFLFYSLKPRSLAWSSLFDAHLARLWSAENSFKHHKHGVQENHVIKSLQERGVFARAVQMYLAVGSGKHSTAEAGKQTQFNATFDCLTGILFKFLFDPSLPPFISALFAEIHHNVHVLQSLAPASTICGRPTPASCSSEPLHGWKFYLTWHRDDTNFARVSTRCRMD